LAQPTVTLSVSSGPPTTKLLVSGSGYDPYSAVDVYFDTKDEALAVTDGSGAFGKIGITVPGSAKPGGHRVTGVERHTGLAGQSRFLVNTNWAEFQFSPDLNGLNPFENVLNPASVHRLGVRWSHNFGDDSFGTAVVNGIVYVGCGNTLYALNASTGALLWQYASAFSDAAYGAWPAVADGIVYFGSGYPDDTIYALNARTGALMWKYTTLNAVHSSPAVADRVVYVSSSDGNLYALDANTGTLLWSYFIADPTSPAVANGVVYIGALVTGTFALDAMTGNLLWQAPPYGYSSPVVADGTVYIGSNNNNLWALNAVTGATLWSYTTGGFVAQTTAVMNGRVYTPANDENLYALDANTGTLVWKYKISNGVVSSPVAANGVIYIGSVNGTLYAFHALSGTLLWTYVTGNSLFTSPAVANGVVFAGDRTLYAFDLAGSDTETAPPPPDSHRLVPDYGLKVSSH